MDGKIESIESIYARRVHGRQASFAGRPRPPHRKKLQAILAAGVNPPNDDERFFLSPSKQNEIALLRRDGQPVTDRLFLYSGFCLGRAIIDRTRPAFAKLGGSFDQTSRNRFLSVFERAENVSHRLISITAQRFALATSRHARALSRIAPALPHPAASSVLERVGRSRRRACRRRSRSDASSASRPIGNFRSSESRIRSASKAASRCLRTPRTRA